MNIPTWLDAIADARLRRATVAVWGRLPEPARGVLEALRPEIKVLPSEEVKRKSDYGLGFTTGLRSGRPGIAFSDALLTESEAVQRCVVAHELCHAILGHWQFPYFAGLTMFSEAEQKAIQLSHEEHVSYVLYNVWGFQAEVEELEREWLKWVGIKPKENQVAGRCHWLTTMKMQEMTKGLNVVATPSFGKDMRHAKNR